MLMVFSDAITQSRIASFSGVPFSPSDMCGGDRRSCADCTETTSATYSLSMLFHIKSERSKQRASVQKYTADFEPHMQASILHNT